MLNYSSQINIINSIVWNNSISNIQFYNNDNQLNVSYSNIENGYDSIILEDDIINWDSSSLDLDPQFTDPENGDFTLQTSSPCIDTGHPDLDGDGNI